MSNTNLQIAAIVLLCTGSVIPAFADDLPATPPPYHSSNPTRIETILNSTNSPVSSVHKIFGEFGGKETDVVDGPVYNPDDTKIFLNGITVNSGGARGDSASGLEFEIVETVSNRFSSTSQVSARYVDPADIAPLQTFINTMAQIAQQPARAGVNAEVTYQTPGGTVFFYSLNGSKTADFEISNGPSSYYTFQFNRLVDVAKFRDAFTRASQWVLQQSTAPATS